MSTPGPYDPSDPPRRGATGPAGNGPSYEQPGYGQQQGYGPPGYGQQAYVPAPGHSATPPTTVQRSFQLWVANIVLSVIGTIVGLVVGISAASEAFAAAGGDAPSALRAGVVVVTVVGAVLFLAIVGLQLFFAFKMRQGRNWARIVLTVLGALGVLVALPGLFGGSSTQINGQAVDTGGGPVVTILTIVSILLTIAAIVLSFQKPSNEYFAALSH